MKKIATTILFTFGIIFTIFAQDPKTVSTGKAAKTFFGELGGNGIGFSANFDSRFAKSEKGFGYRIGLGFFPGIDLLIIKSSTILAVPFGINHLAGKGPSYFESGLGVTFVSGSVGPGSFFEGWNDGTSAHGSGLAFIPSIGYRYAAFEKRGIVGRFTICPIIAAGTSTFWFGISGGMKL